MTVTRAGGSGGGGSAAGGGWAQPPRQWWRVAVLVLVCVAGALAAVGCALAWLLMGFMGTAVQPWEPVVYPAGLVVSLAVPVLAGRWLLRGAPDARRLASAVGVVVLLAAALVAVSVLAT